MKRLAIGVLGAALMLASANAIRGQGSTGGTLGKTDQSLSGDQPKSPPSGKLPKRDGSATAPDHTKRSTCAKAVGVWYWVTQEVTIRANGTITSPGGPGHWSCVDGKLHVFWPGFVVPHEIFSISDDGSQLISLNTASAPKRLR
jgi:hypothetical protein